MSKIEKIVKKTKEEAGLGGKPMKIKDTHKHYAEKYSDGIPDRLERKEGELVWRGKGPAFRAKEYHDKPEEVGYMGGFCGAGHWDGLVKTMKTGTHDYGDERNTINSLSKYWMPMPDIVAKYVLSLPYRTCKDYWDFFVDFGSEEKLIEFTQLLKEYKPISKRINAIVEVDNWYTFYREQKENGSKIEFW